MTYSLSVDPGRAALGWAVWYNGRLVDCGLARGPKPARAFTQPSISRVASAALATIPRHPYRLGAVERMRHYPGKGSSDAKANDLLDLQAIGGLVVGALVPLASVLYFDPSEWMGGSVPEKANQLRVTRALDGNESAVFAQALQMYPKSLQHNMYDGVGIGLHLHGRLLGRAVGL